ncbi:hypothetical protein [Chitinophaga sp.]|uniref:hypothetical protein n=1 Tax=Chitinophaga sp. TaxID=1869181 RepID=UPI002F93C383
MNILFLFFLASFPPVPKDSLYSYHEERCAMAYVTIRHWDLTLKEHGTFNLTYSYRDTRYVRKPAIDFHGIWNKKNDTIILTIVFPLENDCSLKDVRFIESKDTLKAVTHTSICLPPTLARVQRFSGRYF